MPMQQKMMLQPLLLLLDNDFNNTLLLADCNIFHGIQINAFSLSLSTLMPICHIIDNEDDGWISMITLLAMMAQEH